MINANMKKKKHASYLVRLSTTFVEPCNDLQHGDGNVDSTLLTRPCLALRQPIIALTFLFSRLNLPIAVYLLHAVLAKQNLRPLFGQPATSTYTYDQYGPPNMANRLLTPLL